MQPTSVATDSTAIGQVLTKFIAGDPTLFSLIADDVDFRIDHVNDDADTSWQHATSREQLMGVIVLLGEDIFPKGTKSLELNCYELGGGWHLTRFHQAFFYGVRQCDVTSLTYILSHETDGRLDYFRETVTGIVNEPAA